MNLIGDYEYNYMLLHSSRALRSLWQGPLKELQRNQSNVFSSWHNKVLQQLLDSFDFLEWSSAFHSLTIGVPTAFFSIT